MTAWFTLAEAAELTGRNVQTIRRWVREGDLPVRRVRDPHSGRLVPYVRHTDMLEADRVHNRNMWNKKHETPLDVAKT